MLPPDEDRTQKREGADTNSAARIRTVACLAGVSLERGVAADEIHDYIRDRANVVWMDVQNPGQAELALLMEEFGFHPLALEDVAHGRQRPKVDEYKGYLFVVTHGLVSGADAKEFQTAEVDLFIGRNYVVSLHGGGVPALEEAYRRWTRGGTMLREGVGYLVYTVIDALVDAYFPVIDRVEDEIDEVEIGIHTGLDSRQVAGLLRLKRTLVSLRRVLYPMRETFHVFLRRDHPFFSAGTQVYFQDVYDHILRILDVLDIEREMVGGALETYLTVASNRLNATVKALTVVTVCVAVVGAVFGAWGMNFSHIPLSQTPWGFWAVFGGTVALIAGALLVGWRRGWF